MAALQGPAEAALPAPPQKPPHIWMILQDDLGVSLCLPLCLSVCLRCVRVCVSGHFDIGFNNPGRVDVSGNTTALAMEGIVLEHHYTFYWCSPTRRSFLSGRVSDGGFSCLLV